MRIHKLKLLQFSCPKESPLPRPPEVAPIQYEKHGMVAHIWLNRPHKRNCVSQQLLSEIEVAVDRAEKDKEVRAMVFRGRGNTFCSGFEIVINCDFAIADEEALVGDFHIRRALFGGAGPIYRLPRMLGMRKAKEL